ncbi:putative calcium-binding protein CML21 [Phytophthora citrophthora]|uniref:Calcium-binding protein CML21 n=1 Tax=Phytophthora citrophthora TaxID=4793 RepID=A0AAD9GWG2_9STRA|nr:putative calcium-binding protein CML21 [Phytophthora citrophthora]
MGNKPSMLRSSSRADDANSTSRIAAGGPTTSPVVADAQQLGISPGRPVAKLLTANIASIRPVDQAPRVPTQLDQKITNALKERWLERSPQEKEKENLFTRILLKLPQAADAFNSVRTTFQAFDKENKGYIEFSDLSRVFEHLGANFSAEEIGQVFQESDMMEDGKLNFKEFLVCLAIGFVLHKIPSLEGEQAQQLGIFYSPISRTSSKTSSQSILFGEGNKLRLAFQLAIDAFLWFDVDGDGSINRSEISTKLQNSMALHSPTKKMSTRDLNKSTSNDSSNQTIWEQRFMEMDWNGDGTIHFKEFLMAFESWKAFNRVRSTFKKYDEEGRGYIVYEDLPAVLKEVGVSFSKDEINQAFEESDLKENGRLNFKELLVSLAIGFLLLRISSPEKNRLSIFYTTSSAAVGLRDNVELWCAFQLAIDCFLWFDTEGSGCINRNDMSVQLETSMACHSPTKKLKKRSGSYKDSREYSTNWFIWDRRFAEMDWNHNGTIHFNEFLMAFESWVGVHEDEDEDFSQQEENTDRDTSTAQ